MRKGIAIVPQDPVLFNGTVRFNLDPFDAYDDATLRSALDRVQLTELWENQAQVQKDSKEQQQQQQQQQHGEAEQEAEQEAKEEGQSSSSSSSSSEKSVLERPIAESGSNLAVGERQLLCLARALIRGARVLIMDEATANVDPATDEKIQAVIRRELSSATVLTVAHRLGTIIYYDLVMVLDKGKVVEMAPPAQLLADPSTTFYGMCQKTGDLEALIAEANKEKGE